MKIVTSYDYPPIPDRSMDWSAIDSDTYDGTEDDPNRGMIGRGPTEAEAIADLMQLLEDNDILPCNRCSERRGTDRPEGVARTHHVNTPLRRLLHLLRSKPR